MAERKTYAIEIAGLKRELPLFSSAANHLDVMPRLVCAVLLSGLLSLVLSSPPYQTTL